MSETVVEAGAHPLDRTVWSALSSRQSALALRIGRAARFHPAYGMFAAVEDEDEGSLTDLAALVRAHGDVGFFKAGEIVAPPGTTIPLRGEICQMVAQGPIAPPAHDVGFVPLGESDAAEMFALARLTEPGPFFERTHQLGDFIGVKQDGRLVAMAGERMKVAGFTEVSAVCTHPDHRGHGYAAALTRQVASRIQARGETPFLHVFESNAGGIRIYEAMGFALRRKMSVAVLSAERPQGAAVDFPGHGGHKPAFPAAG